MSRFQFVVDHRDTYEVKRLCQVLEVNRSSFYAWAEAALAREQRAAADQALAERIRAVQKDDPAYGAPRVTAELNDGADPRERVNHKRVARVMRKQHLPGLRLRRRVRTTIPDPADRDVPDLLNRDFTADAPNTKYVGDITYLPIATGGFLYLATVIDCCSRALVGWAIANHMRTSLLTDALDMAAAARGSLAGAIFHSDHGAQYVSKDFAASAGRHGLRLSRGAVGSSADNALAESFNATCKRELLAGGHAFPNAETCRRRIFWWANRYNTRRRHSASNYQAPFTYETTLTATWPSPRNHHPRVHHHGARPPARQDCDEARHLSARLLIRPAVGGPGRCRRPRRQIQGEGATHEGVGQ